MKIYQFTPPATPAKIVGAADPARSGLAAGDFSSSLKAANNRLLSSAAPGRIISLENMRATQAPTSGDLQWAGHLLNQLDRDIRRSTPEFMGNMHNLEGLVYICGKR